MLSLGSIVYLKNGDTKLMVTSRGAFNENEEKMILFDYSACIYPLGVDAEEVYSFNEENIDKVIFEGYSDKEEGRFI